MIYNPLQNRFGEQWRPEIIDVRIYAQRIHFILVIPSSKVITVEDVWFVPLFCRLFCHLKFNKIYIL